MAARRSKARAGADGSWRGLGGSTRPTSLPLIRVRGMRPAPPWGTQSGRRAPKRTFPPMKGDLDRAGGQVHAGNPDAQPEAIPDLELRQPGTGQGAITTPKGRGVQLTALGIENVPEGPGVMPESGLEVETWIWICDLYHGLLHPSAVALMGGQPC